MIPELPLLELAFQMKTNPDVIDAEWSAATVNRLIMLIEAKALAPSLGKTESTTKTRPSSRKR